MQIIALDIANQSTVKQAVKLLANNFVCYSEDEDAYVELMECGEEGNILLVAIDGETLVGMIGARPEYDGNVWELHPLVIAKGMQRKGIGTLMVEALEAEVVRRGGITVYLGSDDEDGLTSLSN